MLVTNPMPFTGGNPAGGGGGGSGTVTSIGVALAASAAVLLAVAGSPVTVSGDITLSLGTQSANRVFAGPTSGGAAAPTFRVLVAADVPDLSSVYQPLDADLTAIAALSGTGIAVRSASNTWVQRTVVDAGSSRVTVTNPAGVAGNITLDVAEASLNLASIGGTLAKSQVSSSGAWTAAEIPSLDTSKLTSGTLGVARGGTAAATFTAFAVLCAGTTSTGAFQNVSGLGTSGQVLTSAGAGALPTWADASGGGANAALSNLASVAVSLALTPGTDVAIALDSTAKRYTSGYFGTSVAIYAGGAGAADANASLTISASGLQMGPGGATALDSTIVRSAAELWTIGGATSTMKVGYGNDASWGVNMVGLQFGPNAFPHIKYGLSGSYNGAFIIDCGTRGALSVGTGAAAGWNSASFGVVQSMKLGLNGTYSNASVTPTSYFIDDGTNVSAFHASTEIWRDTGSVFKLLHGRRAGAFTAIGDTNPAARFGGNHKEVVTAVPSTATVAEEDLITYALPAALLSTNGDRMDAAFVLTFAATARTKQIKVYFGATACFDTGAVIFNGGQAVVYMTVIRTGATTQIAMGTFNGDVTLITQIASYTTPAETLANAITVKVTSTVGVGASANDVIAKFATIDYLPVGA